MAAASTANAANGVAQASAKLASAQETVSRAKQNSGAWCGSTGARRTVLAKVNGVSSDMNDLPCTVF
jgi:hypothetical protein